MQKACESTCVTGNGRLPVYQTELRKKYVQNSGCWSWIFSQIPFAASSAILKIPLGSTPCPQASAPASVRWSNSL